MLLTPKQSEYMREGVHRWNFKGGATRSGKTYMDYRWIIPMRIRERAGKEGLTVILGVTKATIERNVLTPMREQYGDNLVGNISSDNTVWLFGEKCYALGAEKISQVSRLRGTSIKYCYGDEVADWSQEVFGLLKSRLDRSYSCFDGTFNPKDPLHWLKEFIDSDADVFYQTYSIDDNPFLDPDFVVNLKKEYAGTVLYERYILGLWAASEGALITVYPEHTEDESKLYNGIAHIDAAFGGSDGSALTCARREGEKIYLYGKLRQAHIDTLMDYYSAETRRLRCSPILIETNADKGFVAKQFMRMGDHVSVYDETMNKFFKIATYLRKWWKNIVIVKGTDKAYIDQIMAYNEQAEHDDAPDSAACVCRYYDPRSGTKYRSPFGG
jgi:hypothetical protein